MQLRPLPRERAEKLVKHLPALAHIKTVAKFFDVDPRTIRRWIEAGRLQAIRTGAGGGGRVRIPRDSVVDLLVQMSGGAE